MMKFLTIGIILSAGFLSVPAFALMACTDLSESTKCTGSPVYNQVDWSVACTGNIAVKGVGICSSTDGRGDIGGKIPSIEIVASSDDTNRHCWCMMTSPLVSYWVFVRTLPTDAECLSNCANGCIGPLVDPYGIAVHAALFSGFED